jgi:pimeloyl-ACP methyl ester carboxylesterase
MATLVAQGKGVVMTTVVFSHGKESGPWGSKIKSLADVATALGFAVESIDYQDLSSPDARVERLTKYITPHKGDVILVGSSMGGYVSLVTAASVPVKGVFLLAPALWLPGYDVQHYDFTGPTFIVHGWQDDITPMSSTLNYAEEKQAQLLCVRDGHRLSQSNDILCNAFHFWLQPFVFKTNRLR